MKKKGFAAIYIVYSLFLVLIIMMGTILIINNYKSSFLNVIKNDVKNELKLYKLEIKD